MDHSLIVPLALLILGCILAWSIAGSSRREGLSRVAVSLAWGPGLAAGLVSLAGFYSLFLGFGRLGRPVLTAILVAAGVVAVLMAPRTGPPADSTPAGEPRRWWDHAGWAAVVCLSLGQIWNYSTWVANRPLGLYDGMAIWTYRALQWTRSGDGFPEVVRLMTESKPDYPLLLPGLITGQFTLWGSESVVIPIATGWFFLVGLAAATFMTVKRWSTGPHAALAVALLLATPMIWRWAFAQSADIAVAYLVLVAAHGLVEMIGGADGGNATSVLTGVFLGLLVWTKNEGLILAVVLVSIAVLAARLRRVGAPRRRWALVAVGALPGIAATVAFKECWVGPGEAGRYLRVEAASLLVDPGRWADIGWAFVGRLVPVSAGVTWGVTWIALIGLLIIAATRRRGSSAGWPWVYYLVVFLTMLIADAGIYLITPEPLGWHLETSLDRLLMQIMPLLLAAVFIAVRPTGKAGLASEHD